MQRSVLPYSLHFVKVLKQDCVSWLMYVFSTYMYVVSTYMVLRAIPDIHSVIDRAVCTAHIAVQQRPDATLVTDLLCCGWA